MSVYYTDLEYRLSDVGKLQNSKYSMNPFQEKKSTTKHSKSLFLPYVSCTETYLMGHGGYLSGKGQDWE